MRRKNLLGFLIVVSMLSTSTLPVYAEAPNVSLPVSSEKGKNATGQIYDPQASERQKAINDSFDRANASNLLSLSGAESGETESGEAAGSLSLPSEYDPRKDDLVTPVKNQYPLETCWTFAAATAMEHNIMRQTGRTGSTVPSLSELQIAWFGLTPVQKGSTIAGRKIDQDQYGEGENENLDAGGAAPMAMQVLSSWEGVTTEDEIPHKAKDGTIRAIKDADWSLEESKRGLSVVHATDMDQLPTPTTSQESGSSYTYSYSSARTDAIKQAVLEKGAVAVSIHAAQETEIDYKKYLNLKKGAQYISDHIDYDHGVCIVGWNDAYSKSDFGTDVPEGDGAFLCKNSWGSYGPYEMMNIICPDSTTQEVSKTTYNENPVFLNGSDLYLLTAKNTFGNCIASNLQLIKSNGISETYKDAAGTEYTISYVKRAGYEEAATWSGYFWLSYYDRSLDQAAAFTADYPEANGTGKYKYDHEYMYDYLGMAGLTTCLPGDFDENGIPAQGANIFRAEGDETLTAVSVRTVTAANKAEIAVYRLPDGAAGPTGSISGEPEFTQTVTIDNAGYHTIPLDQPLYLSKGETFSVVEKVTDQDGYGCLQAELANNPKETAKSGEGESYFSTDNGATWKDLHDYSSKFDNFTMGNAMIRAFTVDAATALVLDDVKEGDILASGTSAIYKAKYATASEAEETAALSSTGMGNYTYRSGSGAGTETASASNAAAGANAAAGTATASGSDAETASGSDAELSDGPILLSAVQSTASGNSRTYSQTTASKSDAESVDWNMEYPFSAFSTVSASGSNALPVFESLNSASPGNADAHVRFFAQADRNLPGSAALAIQTFGKNVIDAIISGFNSITKWKVFRAVQDGYARYIDVAPATGNVWQITATAGTGGTITPEGTVYLSEGEDRTFTIEPESGYHLSALLIDGKSGNKVRAYTFTAVSGNHTIEAQFTENGSHHEDNTADITSKLVHDSENDGKWQQDAVGRWFRFNSGGYAKNTWLLVSGKWFHFNSEGYAQKGWIMEQGKWYYLDPGNCEMKAGWFEDPHDQQKYYLNADGSMATGWVEIDGKWYYFNADPAAPTYTYDPATQTWIWNGAEALPYGALLKNTTAPDNDKVDENGAGID